MQDLKVCIIQGFRSQKFLSSSSLVTFTQGPVNDEFFFVEGEDRPYKDSLYAVFTLKGHDPDSWFSGITFFSGLAPWSLQIKKTQLDGMLIF